MSSFAGAPQVFALAGSSLAASVPSARRKTYIVRRRLVSSSSSDVLTVFSSASSSGGAASGDSSRRKRQLDSARATDGRSIDELVSGMDTCLDDGDDDDDDGMGALGDKAKRSRNREEEDGAANGAQQQKTKRTFFKIDTVNLNELLASQGGGGDGGDLQWGAAASGSGSGVLGASSAKRDPLSILDSVPLFGGPAARKSAAAANAAGGGAASSSPFALASAAAADRRLKAHALVIKKATGGGGGGGSAKVDVISLDSVVGGGGGGRVRSVAGARSNLQVDVEFDLDEILKSAGYSSEGAASSAMDINGANVLSPGKVASSSSRRTPVPILPPHIRVVDDSLRKAYASFDLRAHLKLLQPPSSALISYPSAADHLLSSGEGSALHLAATLNDSVSSRLLLLPRLSGGCGASPTTRDRDGLKPCEVAKLAGYDDLAVALAEAELLEACRGGSPGKGAGGGGSPAKGPKSPEVGVGARDAAGLLQAGGEDVVYDVFCSMDEEEGDELGGGMRGVKGGPWDIAMKRKPDNGEGDEVEFAGHFDPETGDLVLEFEDYEDFEDEQKRLVSEEDDYDSNDEDAIGNDYPDEEDEIEEEGDEEGDDGVDNVARCNEGWFGDVAGIAKGRKDSMDSSDDDDGGGGARRGFRERPVDLGARGMRVARGLWGGADAEGVEDEEEEDGTGGYGDGEEEATEMYAYDPELDDD